MLLKVWSKKVQSKNHHQSTNFCYSSMRKYVQKLRASKVRNLTIIQQHNVISFESNKKLGLAFCMLSFHFSSNLFLIVFFRRSIHDGLEIWKKKYRSFISLQALQYTQSPSFSSKHSQKFMYHKKQHLKLKSRNDRLGKVIRNSNFQLEVCPPKDTSNLWEEGGPFQALPKNNSKTQAPLQALWTT